MKTKKLIIVSLLLLLISCYEFEDDNRFGFIFLISNNTNTEYTNASITIGGMKGGEFIGTETYNFPTLRVIDSYEWNTYGDNKQFIAVGENRWRPNLDLIREIPSDSLYFKLTLTEDNNTLLKNINYEDGIVTTLVSRAIPKNYVIKNDDGYFYIHIWEGGIIGRLLENK